MSRVQPSVLSAFKALKTLENFRQRVYCQSYSSSSVLSYFHTSGKFFSSSTDSRVIREGGQSSVGDGLKGEGQSESVEVESPINLSSAEAIRPDQNPTSSGPPGSTQCESITDRLRRLSVTCPEDFVPSYKGRDAIDKAKLRYKSTLDSYKSQFAYKERFRMQNPNYRRRNQYENDNYHDRNPFFGDQQYRRFSSTARRYNENDGGSSKNEGIIERLRRLSVSNDEEFKPSEGARKIREKAEATWQSRSHLDDSAFDQRRFKPKENTGYGNYNNRHNSYGNYNNGGGYRNEGYRNRDNNYMARDGYDNNWNNNNDGYRGRSNSNSYRSRDDGYQNRRQYDEFDDSADNRRRRNSWSGGENLYEADNLNKDPTRDPRLTQFFKEDQVHTRKPLRKQNYYSEYSANSKEFRSKSNPTWEKVDTSRKMSSKGNQRQQIEISEAAAQASFDEFNGIEENEQQYTGSSHVKKIVEADLDLVSLIEGDTETFGTLRVGPIPAKDSVGTQIRKELMEDEKLLGLSGLDDPEEGDERFIPAKKWNMKKLVTKIKELVDEKKVKEAVDTLLDALNQGGFQYIPGEFVYAYNLCISACAQVGYVQMAFKLFNDMKKRGFPPKASTYTSLFNACANSTWDAEKNVERMGNLRQLMAEKGVALNQVNYHAMIKGYGRCGDLETSFSIVDEMMTQAEIQPNTETFNMLLQACITNTNDGFRHVLVTWRKMQSMRIRPDIYSYNLLLRAIRECGIQIPAEESSEKKIASGGNSKAMKVDSNIQLLPPVVTDEESNDMLNLICLNESEKALCNINQNAADDDNVPQTYEDVIKALALPQNRLAVLGGLRGLLSQMSFDKVGPNMKTVNELALIINPADSGDLLMLMKTYKLKPSIDLFNVLIKQCHMMKNDKKAKELMKCLPEYNVTPNIMTWGVSALGCRSWNSTQKLLNEMDEASFTPNISIMGAFLHEACYNFDPYFVTRVLDETTKREIIPDAKFILELEKFKQFVKKGIINKEMGKPIEPPNLNAILEDFESFEDSWKRFLMRYKIWKKSTEVQVEPNDPWAEEYRNFQKNRTHGTLSDPDDTEQNDNHDEQQFQAKSS